MGYAELIAMLMQAGGSIAGAVTQGNAQAKADKDRMAALNEWDIGIPQMNNYQAPVLKSAFDDISADPRLQAAQAEALSRMMDTAQDGWTTEDKVAMHNAADASNQNERGQREALMQNFAQRGAGGWNGAGPATSGTAR